MQTEFQPIDQSGAPKDGRYRLTPQGVTSFLERLMPSESQLQFRDAAWVILVLTMIDVCVTATGLFPSLSGCVVLATLPTEAFDKPLSFWSPGRVTLAESLAGTAQLALLLVGGWLLGKSDRALWLASLTHREDRPAWRLALLLSTATIILSVALGIWWFDAPLSFPLPLRVVMALAMGVFTSHLVGRVREVTMRHPKLHRSLVKAAVSGISILAGVALASQILGVGSAYPLSLGEMRALASGDGILAGGLMVTYLFFSLMTTGGSLGVLHESGSEARPAQGGFAVEPFSADVAGAVPPVMRPRPARVKRDYPYTIVVIPSGKPFDKITTPGVDQVPPVRGVTDGPSRDQLMVYAEANHRAKLVNPEWLELSLTDHRLIDRKAFRQLHRGRLDLGGREDWIAGKVAFETSIDPKLLPWETSSDALRDFADAFDIENLKDRIAEQLDAKLLNFFGVFELCDGTPLGTSPEILAEVVMESLNVRRTELLSVPPHRSLEDQCIDAARLEFEAEAIADWTKAVGKDARVKCMALAAGIRPGVTCGNLLRNALGLSEASAELADLLTAVKLELIFGSGESRSGFTPKAMQFLKTLSQPFNELRQDVLRASDARVELARERLRHNRDDQVALRDARFAMLKKVAAGVFDAANASHVLSKITRNTAEAIVDGLGFSPATDQPEEHLNSDSFRDDRIDY